MIICIKCAIEMCSWCKQGCACNWTPPVGYDVEVPDDVDDESDYFSADDAEPPIQPTNVVQNNSLRMRLRGGSGLVSVCRDVWKRLYQELVFGSMDDVMTQVEEPEPTGLELRIAHGRRNNVGIFANRDFAPGEMVTWMQKLMWIEKDVFTNFVANQRIPLPHYITHDSIIRFKNFVAVDRKLMETPLVRWVWMNHSMYPNLKIVVTNPDGPVDDRVLHWIATEHIRAGDELTYRFDMWHAIHTISSTWVDPPRRTNSPPPSARAMRKRNRQRDIEEGA